MLQSYSICLRISIANRDYPLIRYALALKLRITNKKAAKLCGLTA